MRKYMLFLIPILLLNIGYALDLSIENPLNKTYTYSYAIPMDITVTDGNGTCWHVEAFCRDGIAHTQYCETLDVVNMPNCEAHSFSVDYDGNYTMMVYAQNDTDTLNVNSTFRVDRTSEFEDAKPYLAGLIIIVLVLGSFFCLKLNDSIEETNMITKFIILFAGVACFMTAGFSSILVINEYLKFEALGENLTILSWAIGSLTIFMFVYLMLMFIKKMISMRSGKWR